MCSTRNGLQLPPPSAPACPEDLPPVQTFVVATPAAQETMAAVRAEVEASHGTKVALAMADGVLLLLTDGALDPAAATMEQIQEVLAHDATTGKDRLVAAYSEAAGWKFGCTAQQQADPAVKQMLDQHEALVCRRPDPAGRSRHEFRAMVQELVRIGGEGAG